MYRYVVARDVGRWRWIREDSGFWHACLSALCIFPFCIFAGRSWCGWFGGVFVNQLLGGVILGCSLELVDGGISLLVEGAEVGLGIRDAVVVP